MGLRNKTFTDEQFIKAVEENISKAGVLKQLSLSPAGANYRMFNILVKRLKLDTSHFKGQGYLKDQHHNWTKKIKLSKILVKNSTYQSNKLKKRLIKEGIFQDCCVRCNISEWQGEKLSLHLDHINGVNTDNRLENVRLLCPNCHSLTPTYCRRK
jgi:hypothetical protein